MRFRWSGPSLVIDTPAKLNLHLEVLGKRPDGYHELETVMVSVGLYDTLELTPGADRIELNCHRPGVPQIDPAVPGDSSNLVCRAAELLRKATGTSRGVRIRLTKRIPAEAGLGGGSSDAAAALVGLNRLWQAQLSPAELHHLASQLGSDVNFFLDSVPLAMCRGRGELIQQQPLRRPVWFVVVKPAGGLSTAAVFRHLRMDSGPTRSSLGLLQAVEAGDVARCGQRLWNALERPAAELSADVARILTRLRSVGASGAALTGSGSACFGLCGNRMQARRMAVRCRQIQSDSVLVLRSAI